MWVWESHLTNSATTQAQIQIVKLSHLKIYFIYGLLRHEKGPAPQIESCRGPITP